MRTTVTLDEDVAAALRWRQYYRGTRWRDEVNEVLRAGLAADADSSSDVSDYALPTFDAGRQLMDTRTVTQQLDAEGTARGLPPARTGVTRPPASR